MATGPEHYTAAQKLLTESHSIGGDDLSPAQLLMATLAEAQVHATLALAAATALDPIGDDRAHPDATASPDAIAWWNVTSVDGGASR